VFLGGGQTQRVLSEVLRAISVVSRNPLTVEVVSTAPLGATLRDAGLETLPRWISWLGTVDSLAPVYARADLAIGACGSACWERLCLRLPSVLIQTAANQRFVAEAMARRAPALFLGEAGSLSRQAWEQALASRLDEFADRIGLEAFPEIDGEGALRVARYMLRAAP
jgi:spore coat polysaccharide biosynthesis predicted glycosyltransferase SpsG